MGCGRTALQVKGPSPHFSHSRFAAARATDGPVGALSQPLHFFSSAAMQRQVVLVASSAESSISAWCARAPARTRVHLLLAPYPAAAAAAFDLIPTGTQSKACRRRVRRRDLNTNTYLTSYKGNASPRNGLCCVGPDYLVAAQSSKDALQFWTWHKARAAADAADGGPIGPGGCVAHA